MIKRLVLALALLATACTSHLDRGVVTGKDYTPESTYEMPQYMTTCTGSPPICSQTLIGFIPITSPESWTLHLKDGDKTGDHDVSEDEFNKYNVGSTYP